MPGASNRSPADRLGLAPFSVGSVLDADQHRPVVGRLAERLPGQGEPIDNGDSLIDPPFLGT